MSDVDLAHLRERLAGTPPSEPMPEGFRRAAVLVPVLLSEAGTDLLFTVRSSRLRHHAGQIAFPGGAIDPGETPEEAARREAWEEVGLAIPPEGVIGRLADLPSPAGFVATPVVAVASTPASYRLNPFEVEEAFTVPLGELRRVVPTTETRPFRGTTRVLHHYVWGGRDIWGFTGNVLRELLAHLAVRRPSAAPPEAAP